ncbi:MAG: chromosomal replication initiator protein DnaA [Desulfuromonadales bacterium]
MERLWQETLKNLEQKLSPQHFRTWIKPICFAGVKKDLIYLEVANKFVLDWIRENYSSMIQEIASNIGAVDYTIQWQIAGSNGRGEDNKVSPDSTEEVSVTPRPQASIGPKVTSNLNQKYTFDSFVSGSSNQFAHAASMAVSTNPATTYNPLFIYGGVGLGKTHLLMAIGNAILKTNPEMRVCYYASEKFMNELINSLRYAKMDDFRNKFRSMDVLLIDDVQFIAGKERTQEEFFHTFNALYDSHKQIVVTSDKFPKEIPGLEERLRSRFEWGLIADIQSPDVETKQAILKMKAEQNNINLPPEVGDFLANSVTSNVRELEGYLVRIGAYASLTAVPITLDMAKEVLKDILVDKTKVVTVEEIQKTVAHHFNVKISDLKSKKRLQALVLPRQIAMYLSRRLTACSFPEIGEKFGGKDHSTIIHAIKKIDQKISENEDLEKKVNSINNALSNNYN